MMGRSRRFINYPLDNNNNKIIDEEKITSEYQGHLQ